MRVIKEFLVATIISLEFVVLLVGAAGILVWQEQLARLTAMLSSDPEFLKYLALLPVGIAVWIFSEARTLLLPDGKARVVLHQWPDYWRLKAHFAVSLMYTAIFTVTGLAAWAFGLTAANPKGFVLLATSVLGQLIVAVSVYLAKISVSEIFGNVQNSSNN